MQEHLDWLPMPADIERGSTAKMMALPAIRPSQYGSWKDFQQAWFWNLFWASAKHGGYLPAGSELWQAAGAHTRARWDANCAAVLVAFGCTQPDAGGRFAIYYPPLLEILGTQKKKYRKKAGLTLSETSTGLHNGESGYSPSIPLSFDFGLDSKNQNLDVSSTDLESSAMSGQEKTREPKHSDIQAAARRIINILTLPEDFLTAAIIAVEVETKKWADLSMDGAVQNITTAANSARRKDISHQEFLQDFLAQKLAKQVLQAVNLSEKDDFIRRMALVIKAEARDTGLPIEETAIRIAQFSMEDRRRNIPINIFYFEDMKWRSNAGTSKAEQRKLNNLAASERAREILRQQRG